MKQAETAITDCLYYICGFMMYSNAIGVFDKRMAKATSKLVVVNFTEELSPILVKYTMYV